MTVHIVDTPSADDVRQLFRRANRWVAFGFLLLLVVGGVTVYYAAGGRAASKDNLNATSVQLANGARNACITERRNAQAEAIGRETIAAHRAQAAGLLEHNEAEAAKQAAIVAKNAALWETATKSLSQEVLNQKPPVGCGPPILTIQDLREAQR